MIVTKLTSKLSVGPQIVPADVEELKRRGFRAIIVNRLDGESADQPGFAEIEAAATDADLETRNIPVERGMVTPANAVAFADAVRELPGPVFAFCQSGTRSRALWTLNEANSPCSKSSVRR